jgi:hypothetical protein
MRGTPAEQIGYVEASDEATAIKEAIKQYGITDRNYRQRTTEATRGASHQMKKQAAPRPPYR